MAFGQNGKKDEYTLEEMKKISEVTKTIQERGKDKDLCQKLLLLDPEAHALSKHEKTLLPNLVETIENTRALQYASGTYDDMADITSRFLKSENRAFEIAKWLVAGKSRSLEISATYANPIGHAIGMDRKDYECRCMKFLLKRDNSSELGFAIRTAYPDIERGLEVNKALEAAKSKTMTPAVRYTGFSVPVEAELTAENLSTPKRTRLMRLALASVMQSDLENVKVRDFVGRSVIEIADGEKRGFISLDDNLRMSCSFRDKGKENNANVKTLGMKFPEAKDFIQDFVKNFTIAKYDHTYENCEIVSDDEVNGFVSYTDEKYHIDSLHGMPQTFKAEVTLLDKEEVHDGYISLNDRLRGGRIVKEYEFTDNTTGLRETIDPDKVGDTILIEPYKTKEENVIEADVLVRDSADDMQKENAKDKAQIVSQEMTKPKQERHIGEDYER